MSNLTNLTNKTNLSNKKSGYRNLIVYHLAVQIDDLNWQFCRHNLSGIENSRTRDQMIQASRSGKQNIVEGSLEQSMEGNIKLTGVARASYGELLEDFLDFLRRNKLPVWEKNDLRVLKIRAIREQINPNSNLTNLTNWSNWTNSPETYANLMITLINKETYLLDRLLEAQKQKFVKEGGFREKLFKKRWKFKRKINL